MHTPTCTTSTWHVLATGQRWTVCMSAWLSLFARSKLFLRAPSSFSPSVAGRQSLGLLLGVADANSRRRQSVKAMGQAV
eukprot:227837-Chlamydomonas_euryale.AAC.1